MANDDAQELENAEARRLERRRRGAEDWNLWGPYLAERAWGTVREDYSANGDAWSYFDHNQAHGRAYRWNEDGLGGICDVEQRLCLALALWNGHDPVLKERAFGLTGHQGNRGEDVKEYYFYVDAAPSHAYLRYLYKYPQAEYPYERLVEENRRRTRQDPAFNLLDTGALDDGRYWDVEVRYAKATPEQIHVRIHAGNRGPATAPLHILPQLWFRNTWSWDEASGEKPQIKAIRPPRGAAWAAQAEHPTLGTYYFYGAQEGELLFTENETNHQALWGSPNRTPYTKDGIHRRVVHNEATAVNPARTGSKLAAWHRFEVAAGSWTRIELALSAHPLDAPFSGTTVLFAKRRSETDVFYDGLLPEASPEDHRILRQCLAGMIWTKQFFHYDVERWLDGDHETPPAARRGGRNAAWRHLKAADILSMPDCWEYPWFAAWDLAYQCASLALVDVDFAKSQIELMVSERYLHPNGQIPAYEWAFGDVNPPVHAWGAVKVFRAERRQRGDGDIGFLERVFHKLLLNYAWWINRKDSEGHNVFEGGFLGLDNISVYDRSRPLPPGYSLKQADGTGWMAMFAVNMTVIALEIAAHNPAYEDIAIQCYEQFLAIANAIAGGDDGGLSLWDEEAGFFKDLLVTPDGEQHRIDVYSWVGIIPLFACEVVDQGLLHNTPRFRALLKAHGQGLFRGHFVCPSPEWENARGEHLLALVDDTQLAAVLDRLLDEEQFLSRYGVRSVSRSHARHKHLGEIPGIGEALIEYVPGEANSPLFGGNSNWRGPIWLPTNYSLVQVLEKYYRFLGDTFTVPVRCLGGQRLNLKEIATLIAERLVDLYRRDENGIIPALRRDSPFQSDPHWQDLAFYYEYFHGETGQGLGAAHQTGWTGLLANLTMRRYRKDIPAFWEGDAG